MWNIKANERQQLLVVSAVNHVHRQSALVVPLTGEQHKPFKIKEGTKSKDEQQYFLLLDHFEADSSSSRRPAAVAR